MKDFYFICVLDLTPELEVRKSLLDSARAELESFSLVGKRLVSETEWQLLEEEVSFFYFKCLLRLSFVPLIIFKIVCSH